MLKFYQNKIKDLWFIIMEKLFENTTTYTPEVYNDFVIFHNQKYSLKYHLYTLFILFLIVFCMVLQFLYGNIALGILFVFAMVLFLVWRVFHPTFFVKKEAKSDKVQKQMKNTYSFYDKYMTIKNSKDNIKLGYYKLYKVFENDDYFYLYINKNYSFVLAKDTFSIGNSNEFYKFIKKKLWYKII